MTKSSRIHPLFLALALTLLAGCGSSSSVNVPPAPAPLGANNINLIFVVSPDLAFSAPGDVSPDTANLTGQGLRRSLMMATFLRQTVLGGADATALYALAPNTHLQTANHYPDMAALAGLQQFAMLNPFTMSQGPGTPSATANSYPINASYSTQGLPPGAAAPDPVLACPGCQGLDFNDAGGGNEAIANRIAAAGAPGFYVFSAPWETLAPLMANLNRQNGYNLSIPERYAGPNAVFALSIAAPGAAPAASFTAYDAHLAPTADYPAPPAAAPAACGLQAPFRIVVAGGSADGAVVPNPINTNETLHIIRHADAHPVAYFADGNYVGTGQWRSLLLPGALAGKIAPTQVYSIDPSQVTEGTISPLGSFFSNVAPALTAAPYAIANNLPYNLVSSFLITDPDKAALAKNTSDYFFASGRLSGQTSLLAWQYVQIPLAVNALIARYYPSGIVPADKQVPAWPATDYDTVWTVHLDSAGNLIVDNALCEGIDSAALPSAPPLF